MEWLFEILLDILISADFVTLVVDVVVWIRGRNNRLERREARRSGLPPPPRDAWNKGVLWLTAVVVLLTGLIVWHLV
jgi:hypothetical protein